MAQKNQEKICAFAPLRETFLFWKLEEYEK